jgi:hypothetical protein
MGEEVEPPFASADAVRRSAEALLASGGEEARRYLRTISLYNGDGWPGLADLLNA